MVDLDRRLHAGLQAHVAGLRRLSARASQELRKPVTSPRKGCFSFAPLAHAAIDRLRKHNVQVACGLTDDELCRIEAPLALTFPPDLKAILQEGLPVGVGFPDWRSGNLTHLRLLLNLPIAGLSYEVARGRFWLKHWGTKPSDTKKAVAIALTALKRAPLLIPLYRNCYIPSSPNLAGNPVYYVCQQEVFCCGFDLADFFEKHDFLQPERKLSCNFTCFDSPNGRELRSVEMKSLQSDNKFDKSESALHGSRNSDGDVDELASHDRSFDMEGWGRHLDTMAKRHGRGALLRSSLELHNNKFPVFRRHEHSVDLSNEHYANDRIAALNLSRIARRIEFWSDLAGKKDINSSDHLSMTVENGMLLDSDHSDARDDTFSSTMVDFDVSRKQVPTPYWLERYFDKMAMMLRNGGWKEGDIAEMFDVVSPPHDRKPDLAINSASMIQGLILYVSILSDALRRAGWSTSDVAEAFDVELTLCEQKRRPSTLPPHVAVKMGRLAEYAAQL